MELRRTVGHQVVAEVPDMRIVWLERAAPPARAMRDDFRSDNGKEWSGASDRDCEDSEAASCPEFGGPIQIATDECPSCGY